MFKITKKGHRYTLIKYLLNQYNYSTQLYEINKNCWEDIVVFIVGRLTNDADLDMAEAILNLTNSPVFIKDDGSLSAINLEN